MTEFKIPRIMFIDDERLGDAYVKNLNNIVWEYVYKFGVEAVARQLRKKKYIRNAETLNKRLESKMKQLDMFTNEIPDEKPIQEKETGNEKK